MKSKNKIDGICVNTKEKLVNKLKHEEHVLLKYDCLARDNEIRAGH